MTILYRSETLCIRAAPGGDERRWVVSFDNYGGSYSLDRPGFGEAFFARRGISAVTVVGRGNDWYQYADMAAALEAVRVRLGGALRIMTYGSSMGGYAALRFADRVGAHACLALSPQYSNDPAVTPFETRWLQEARSLRWLPEFGGPLRAGCRPLVVFDPCSGDAGHVAMIARDIAVDTVAIPYAAHPVSVFLNSGGLLAGLVRDMLDDRLDVAAFGRDALARRHRNAVCVGELSRRQPAARPRLAVALARRAIELEPGSLLSRQLLADGLLRLGRHDEALALHREVTEASGGDIGYVLPCSVALAAAGKADEALDIARRLLPEHAMRAPLRFWLAHLHRLAGDMQAAVDHSLAAVELDPADPAYRAALEEYRRLAREAAQPALVRWTRSRVRRKLARLRR